MSLDVHVHPWTRSFVLKNPPIVKACKFFNLNVRELPDTIDQLVSEMKISGVERGVVLGQDTRVTRNPNFSHYTITNDELRSIARRYDDTFIPFAGIDPNGGSSSVRELKRAIKDLGFRGLKIHSSVSSVYPNDKRKMFPIYEISQEKGIPVLFHTGTTGLGDCEIRYSKPEYFDEIAQHFPELKIIMAHFGWPWIDVCLAIALRNPNVYIDVSGWKPKYIPSSLLSYMNGPLRDRFLFGTDYPMIRHTDWMKSFKEYLEPKLKAGIAERLLAKNAKRLLTN